MASCSMSKEVCGFQCTGADFSDVWEELHNKIVPKMKQGCETCGSHAEELFKGVHDHVNAGLGKPVFDHANYIKYADEVACVKKAYCDRTGRC